MPRSPFEPRHHQTTCLLLIYVIPNQIFYPSLNSRHLWSEFLELHVSSILQLRGQPRRTYCYRFRLLPAERRRSMTIAAPHTQTYERIIRKEIRTVCISRMPLTPRHPNFFARFPGLSWRLHIRFTEPKVQMSCHHHTPSNTYTLIDVYLEISTPPVAPKAFLMSP